MTGYLAARLVAAVPVMVGLSLLLFVMLRLVPGDPLQTILGTGGAGEMPAEVIERMRREFGLDQPVPLQYVHYLARAVQGDLGRSMRTDRPVTALLAEQFPSTVALAATGMLIAVAIGLVTGAIAAYRRASWADGLVMGFALVGVSMPSFWLGMMLILVFAVTLNVLPVTSDNSIRGMILPALTLGLGAAGIIARLTRSSMLEVIRQDYMCTARSKGLTEFVIAKRHALRNAMLPIVTLAGLQFGHLLAGAFIVEVVFSRQGVGTLVIQSILNKDYPVVQGAVLLAAAAYVLVNIAVDVAYAALDPRIRYG